MKWTDHDIQALAIAGATDGELDEIRSLLKVWKDRLDRNLKRTVYYDSEQAFKDLGLTLPPQLRAAKFYLGWATAAVRKPALRSQFEGLRLPGSDDPFDLNEVLERNQFSLELVQGIHAAGKHGVSFVTVARGLPGEPDVQIQGHSAESAAAIWDRRTRRVSSALTVSEMGKDGPEAFIVYMADRILWCSKDGGWSVDDRIRNPIGRSLVVPITHDPQLGKPFGRSRITNPVMSLTDMAVRAYVRMEGNAEFYSSPQLAIEGIDPDAFEGDLTEQRKFKLAMDRIIALTKDEDGDKPTIKQMQQATMTPHSDMLRTVAMAFSGETGIPPSSLGIIHDQPASAEAIRAAEHDMLIDVTYHNKYVYSEQVKDIARLAIMVRDGLSEAPAESYRLSAPFADPEFRSLSAKSDAVQKLASSMEEIVRHPVLLEEIFDPDKVERIKSDAVRAAAPSLLERVMQSREQTPPTEAA